MTTTVSSRRLGTTCTASEGGNGTKGTPGVEVADGEQVAVRDKDTDAVMLPDSDADGVVDGVNVLDAECDVEGDAV